MALIEMNFASGGGKKYFHKHYDNLSVQSVTENVGFIPKVIVEVFTYANGNKGYSCWTSTIDSAYMTQNWNNNVFHPLQGSSQGTNGWAEINGTTVTFGLYSAESADVYVMGD